MLLDFIVILILRL